MKPLRTCESDSEERLVSRRTVISGSVATGVTVLGAKSTTAQSTPAASPVVSGEIEPARIMALSANLCGGAILKAEHVDGLIVLLSDEADIATTLAELEAISWFTQEDLSAASPEAQRIAANILQYWFLGRYNGEPVDNRTELYFDLASWQSLPYQTQQSACKGLDYWAIEFEL